MPATVDVIVRLNGVQYTDETGLEIVKSVLERHSVNAVHVGLVSKAGSKKEEERKDRVARKRTADRTGKTTRAKKTSKKTTAKKTARRRGNRS